MLYTSGTTAKPKGVPRRQRAERAAAVAHVAQNLYGHGERTLGVMPLYHTMGVRSLLAMSVIGGAFVCLPRFDVKGALALIAAERVTNLYLVPTLYHDLVHDEAFKDFDTASVRKLGFAGAPMTDGLLKELQAAFNPELFVNHYGSSEIYTFTIDQDAPRSPARPAAPASTRWCGWSRSAPMRPTPARRSARRAKSSRCSRATNPSKATGAGPRPTPSRCARAGISPATPATSTPTAISSSPAASTT